MGFQNLRTVLTQKEQVEASKADHTTHDHSTNWPEFMLSSHTLASFCFGPPKSGVCTRMSKASFRH